MGFLLLQIALPRLLLLYILDESANSSLVVKAVGHQWYWRYEYNDFFIMQEHVRLEMDSYIIPTNELKFSSHRPGLFFGQCSEICGANHSFIPIVVEIVNVGTFYKWLIRNE